MTNLVARAVADNAPEEYAQQLQLIADPQLRSDLAMVNARPARIKKLRVEQAIRVLHLVEDPTVLVGVRRVEKRVNVRAEIETHSLARTISHMQWCAECSGAGTYNLAELDTLIATYPGCPMLPVSIIELTSDTELALRCWENLSAGWSTDACGAAAAASALIASAAGRIPRDIPWVQELRDTAAGSWTVSRWLQELLPREPEMTIELVRTWLLRRSELPPFRYTAELLVTLAHEFPESDAISIGMHEKLLNEDHIRELWPMMKIRQRVAAIQASLDEQFAIWALEQLACDAEFDQQNRGPRWERMVRAVTTFPHLNTRHRLIALSAGEYDSLVRFAFGELGVSPRVGEVRAAAEALFERREQLDRTLEYAKANSNRNQDLLNTPAAVELVQILTERTSAPALLAGSTPLSKKAHHHLWGALTSEAERTTALGLLESWTANIDSLIATVKLLEYQS